MSRLSIYVILIRRAHCLLLDQMIGLTVLRIDEQLNLILTLVLIYLIYLSLKRRFLR